MSNIMPHHVNEESEVLYKDLQTVIKELKEISFEHFSSESSISCNEELDTTESTLHTKIIVCRSASSKTLIIIKLYD